MNKTIIGIVVGIVVLGGVGFALMNNKKDIPANDTTTQSTTSSDNMADMNATHDQAGTSDQNALNPDTKNAQATSDVVMQNTAFSPTKITVKVGTKVTWTNKDSVQHDVAPDEDYGDDFKGSELLSKGQSYSFTFNKAGTYTYHCTPHPFMKATVIVTE